MQLSDALLVSRVTLLNGWDLHRRFMMPGGMLFVV